ncbi:MAG: STAS/SEC14 domain-containing protein [Polyangiaceae bacterium]
MKAKNASTAVITDSALVRGVARAVGFLGVPVRAFAPVERASALNYLVVPASRHAQLIQRIEILKNQLSIRPPVATIQKAL